MQPPDLSLMIYQSFSCLRLCTPVSIKQRSFWYIWRETVNVPFKIVSIRCVPIFGIHWEKVRTNRVSEYMRSKPQYKKKMSLYTFRYSVWTRGVRTLNLWPLVDTPLISLPNWDSILRATFLTFIWDVDSKYFFANISYGFTFFLCSCRWHLVPEVSKRRKVIRRLLQ